MFVSLITTQCILLATLFAVAMAADVQNGNPHGSGGGVVLNGNARDWVRPEPQVLNGHGFGQHGQQGQHQIQNGHPDDWAGRPRRPQLPQIPIQNGPARPGGY